MNRYRCFNTNHFKLRRFRKMGKPPYVVTDTETEDTNSCTSNVNKTKKKFSILKYANGSVKKKKFRIPSKSEPDDSDYRSKCTRCRSNQKVRYKLPGILKKPKNTTNRETSEDEDEIQPFVPSRPQDRYLVGTVPGPAGANPGRGGGFAILVKKNLNCNQGRQSLSSNSAKSRSGQKRSWLSRKRSY